MMGIGWTEILVLGVIALVVMGPEQFPNFAKTIIRAARDLRGYWDEIRVEVEKEVKKPLERELRPLQQDFRNMTRQDPDNYTRTISPEKPAPVENSEASTTQNNDTPPPANDSFDEPVLRNPEDEKVYQAGTQPYASGGPGANASESPAPAEAPAADTPTDATATSTSEALASEFDVSPPNRVD